MLLPVNVKAEKDKVPFGELMISLAKEDIYSTSGVAWYKDGKYIGFTSLPDNLLELPIEEIAKTPEISEKYRKITSGGSMDECNEQNWEVIIELPRKY